MPLTDIAIDDHVATLTIDASGGRADRAFMEALAAASERIGMATDDVYAVVVTGVGDDFCVGWSEQTSVATDGGSPLGAGVDALAAVPQPVVAALRGRVHSVGLEIALACDIRVAGERATFAMPETTLGAVPAGGGTQRLPRAIGRAQALRLLLTGEQIDAAEGRRIGLLSRVVPDGEALGAAREIALTIASRGPIATRLAKEAVHRGAEMPLPQGLRYELDLTLLLQTTADRAEGVRAFAAKRPPDFIGR